MATVRQVWIVRAPDDTMAAAGPVTWAVSQLAAALTAQALTPVEAVRLADVPAGATAVVVAGHTTDAAASLLAGQGLTLPRAPEALALAAGQIGDQPVTLATGHDERGLVYAVLELADRIRHGADPLAALRPNHPLIEQPTNPIRGVARLFVSEVEDTTWYHDRDGWRRYLTMLASQRFNRLHLAFGIGHDFLRQVRDATLLFAYPYLVKVPGYDVRATGLTDTERDRNLATLRFISDEARARGLHFQLGLWTHGYTWVDSPDANATIEGLTPATHAAYCRDALRTILEACPGISGVTIRVHGESGVPEGSYNFWRTVFEGAARGGRPIALDLHPKGLDDQMLHVALDTGLPVTISPKYSAEHMGLPYHQAAIRDLERLPHGPGEDAFVAQLMRLSGGALRYTRYGYADFLREDREYGVFFRIWPGTQRLLLWGDPALATGFGRYAHLCGCLGAELCEPLSFKGRRGSGLPGGRDAYADSTLRPAGGDWEKYAYTYRLFGRLLYHPTTDPTSWRRNLSREFGTAAASVETALAHASRILPLVTMAHHPSAANNRYWPELYTNMPIVDEARSHPYGDTPSPKRFGTVSALDPALFASIEETADALLRGERDGRYTPLRVAAWLDGLAATATRHLREAEGRVALRTDASFRRLAIDVAIQAALGRFFAAKLRAGLAYALYRRTGEPARLAEALTAYRAARAAWAEAVVQGQVYRDDITVGGEPWLRGHWADRLPAIDADLADMEAEWGRISGDTGPSLTGTPPLAALDDAVAAPACTHAPPPVFEPGQPMAVVVHTAALPDAELEVWLHYRHVNQAEAYQRVAMEPADGSFTAVIPAAYTDSPYPLLYFFELRDGHGHAWLYPGLAADLANQPYFVVRQAGAADHPADTSRQPDRPDST